MTRIGREYLRVSQDRSGRMRSPAEQHGDNIEHANQRQMRLGDPYQEAAAVGASRHSRGKRDDFARLLDDLRTGTFGADELWLWEPSRGSRRVREWVDLVDACEAAGVLIWVTTHRRLYEPTNHRDRRTLLEDAVGSEYASAETSERVKRAVRARAAAGRPHGKLLYGYAREYEGKHYVRTVIDPTRGPIMAEVYRRYADGEGFTAIATDLTHRAIPTPQGAPVWRASTLRNLVGNRGHLGHRTSLAGHATITDAWPALIDETTWRRVQRRLADPRRPVRQDSSVKHLLSGLPDCGVCDGRMVYNINGGRSSVRTYPTYICCDRRCVGRMAGAWTPDDPRGLEGQVVEFVLELWTGDERLGQRDADPRADALGAQLSALYRRLEDYRVAGAQLDGPSPAAVAAVERELSPQIDDAERRLAQLRAPATLPDLAGRSLREAWPALSLAQQRTIIAASVTIRVLPVGRGKRYDPASVVITPRW